jgi:predicted kinase
MKSFKEWQDDKVLYIMRGVPGSGKSYTARQIMASHGAELDPTNHIFSTDDFFGSGEEYKKNWAAEKLGRAHAWNFDRFKEAVHKGTSPIIIDNTNIKSWQWSNYVEYAKRFGYRVEIKESESPWWLDHRNMLHDKQKYSKELTDFAAFLSGNNPVLSNKYGVKSNVHGVPFETIRSMLDKWEN